jgi:hypothetical protein
MAAATGVFGGVGHDIEAIPAEQQAVFAVTEACVIERLSLERSDRFPESGAAREQQRCTRQGMVTEDGKHQALLIRTPMKRPRSSQLRITARQVRSGPIPEAWRWTEWLVVVTGWVV